MPERMRGSRRVRLLTLWIVTALLVGAYLALPSGDEGAPSDAASASAEAGEPHKLEIVNVSPAETPPGTTVIIRYRGADDGAELSAFAGKVALEVLARRPGSMVARLPADIAYGRSEAAHRRRRPAQQTLRSAHQGAELAQAVPRADRRPRAARLRHRRAGARDPRDRRSRQRAAARARSPATRRPRSASGASSARSRSRPRRRRACWRGS